MAAETIQATSATPKRAADHIPFCKDQGMPQLAGAADAGVTVQARKVTQSGASPFALAFADHGFAAMENTDYVVIVQGETAGQPMVDESTMTVDGFSVLNGADTEVLHVVVIGRLAGQVA